MIKLTMKLRIIVTVEAPSDDEPESSIAAASASEGIYLGTKDFIIAYPAISSPSSLVNLSMLMVTFTLSGCSSYEISSGLSKINLTLISDSVVLVTLKLKPSRAGSVISPGIILMSKSFSRSSGKPIGLVKKICILPFIMNEKIWGRGRFLGS